MFRARRGWVRGEGLSTPTSTLGVRLIKAISEFTGGGRIIGRGVRTRTRIKDYLYFENTISAPDRISLLDSSTTRREPTEDAS